MDDWAGLRETADLLSPSLVIDRGKVAANLRHMIRIAGGPERLRPHVKTHKMPAIVRMAEELGVHKHKCATIAEAEMVAEVGGRDVLIAYPVVGPNVARLAALMRHYPETTFRALVDDVGAAEALSAGLADAGRTLPVLVDLEIGMGRTGIAPGDGAAALYRRVAALPNLEPDGLHGYDGHLNDPSRAVREEKARPGIDKVLAMRDRLVAEGLPVPRLVMGGTPTFPIHATNDDPAVECSPGTCVLHDAGYGFKYDDLPFSIAAVLFTRVVSRPRPGRLTLDLGHKAVAADPVGARVWLLDLPDATIVGQSEEHLVVETDQADRFPPGSVLLAYPMHICPTCALHRRAYVVENGQVVDEWEVAARDRRLRF